MTRRGAPAQKAPAISLDIERLVIDGVPLAAGESARLVHALERELSRLLSAGGAGPGLPDRGRAVHYARAPEIRVTAPASGAALGRMLAHSVYRALEHHR